MSTDSTKVQGWGDGGRGREGDGGRPASQRAEKKPSGQFQDPSASFVKHALESCDSPAQVEAVDEAGLPASAAEPRSYSSIWAHPYPSRSPK